MKTKQSTLSVVPISINPSAVKKQKVWLIKKTDEKSLKDQIGKGSSETQVSPRLVRL